jgi:hypothetical protein
MELLLTESLFLLMQIFKAVLDFYIKSSIHVALSVFALVRITGYLFVIVGIENVAFFAFFGTIVGYNFVKYDALARTQKITMSLNLKLIAFFSFLCLLAAIYFFWKLENITKILGCIFLILTLLYTLPFFPDRQNARNWAGVKIYIVTLCWVGVTVILPIINSDGYLENNVLIVAIQRFLLVFVLVLVFEIIDLPLDDVHLKTVPQTIGIKRTKQIGVFLMLVFVLLEFFDENSNLKIFIFKVGISITTILFLIFASDKKSKYYSTFWVESIPIFWWILLFFFR